MRIACVSNWPYTLGRSGQLSLSYQDSIKKAILTIRNQTFDTPVLRQLVRAGKAGELVAKGVPGGFVLAMREGLDEQLLRAQRGDPRKFKRLEAVASYLKDLGAKGFSVELEQWAPESLHI